MSDTKVSDLPPPMLTVSSDTAQLREDLEMLRRGDAIFGELSRAMTLLLIGRLLSIVERLEDRMLRR